jgi:hypothetical protein
MEQIPFISTLYPPEILQIPEMSVDQLTNIIHEINRMLGLRNEQLKVLREDLRISIRHLEDTTFWQRRCILLGEQHIELLDEMRGQNIVVSQSTPLPAEGTDFHFDPKMCSSPFSTPPSLGQRFQGATHQGNVEPGNAAEFGWENLEGNDYGLVNDRTELDKLSLLAQCL